MSARAPGYRTEAWRRALLGLGVDDREFAAQLAEHFIRERRDRHVALPDARATLEQLGRTHVLGLITDGAPGIQRAKLDGVGLARYFEVVLISGEVGFGKPDRRIFALALDRLGVAPGEAAMVGDSLSRDVGGALGAGLEAIWIDRAAGEAPAAGVTPDLHITELSQLLQVLD